ncbi:MAG: hypothetical protein ICCCNLDF_03723 [Planctomycetes bacterium]|nr:hypothetical protein [Planctomycetota bacterium]
MSLQKREIVSLAVGIEEAASLLGVSADTVRRLVKSQELTAFRGGTGRRCSKLLIRREAINEFVARREAQGVA